MTERIILMVLIFLAFGIKSYTQKKGDNTIVIPHYISSKTIKGILFQNGYTVDAGSDTSFLFSGPKKVANSILSVKLNFAITDTAVFIKGLYKFDKNDPLTVALAGKDAIEPQFENIEYYKVFKKQTDWDELNRIAKLLSPTVIYLKQ